MGIFDSSKKSNVLMQCRVKIVLYITHTKKVRKENIWKKDGIKIF